MGHTAVIFPGQGAQTVGMGRDVFEASAAARGVFKDANRILGFDLAEICFHGPAERLNATDVSQPAIFVTSAAIWAALRERPETADAVVPQATAGLSLGEYTALWLAGSLGFEDALRLVHDRGRFMQAAAEARNGVMVSVLGLNRSRIDEVLEAAAGPGVLVAANYNSPAQTVLSGDTDACDRAIHAVDRLGGRAVRLRVAGAFHSPLMQPAADRLREVLAATNVATPGIPVVSNVSAEYHRGPDEIRRLLETQVTQSIHWHASIERLVRDGYDRFVEVGPGRVLTGLMRNINRGVQTINVSTAATLRKLAESMAVETTG
ncbi:MAG: ACP S-malonyltransferase [Phycisphaerae bacterium]